MIIEYASVEPSVFEPRATGSAASGRASGFGPKLLVGIFVASLAVDVTTRVVLALAGRSWRRAMSALRSRRS
jgi:hypothetical protein